MFIANEVLRAHYVKELFGKCLWPLTSFIMPDVGSETNRVPWIIQLENSFCTEESVPQRTAVLIERHTLTEQRSKILAEQVLLQGELLLPFSEPLRHNFLPSCLQLSLPLLRAQLKTGPALTRIHRDWWSLFKWYTAASSVFIWGAKCNITTCESTQAMPHVHVTTMATWGHCLHM